MRLIFLSLLLFSLLTACGSSRSSGKAAVDPYEQRTTVSNVDLSQGMDLTTHIRRVPGVLVQGEGASATIRVRGTTTINSNPEPLYIVGGMNMGNDFSEVYAMVDIQMVDKIRVLKDAADTGIYGVQGGNGVIIIELKKQ
ncbi:MAG: TonB-dependent receptor plug domain-containing protein [Bacteroidota bacterium]